MDGEATGFETWGSWQATRIWRLYAGGTLLDQRLRLKPESRDITGVSAAGNDPKNQWTLGSALDLPGGVEEERGLGDKPGAQRVRAGHQLERVTSELGRRGGVGRAEGLDRRVERPDRRFVAGRENLLHAAASVLRRHHLVGGDVTENGRQGSAGRRRS